MFLFLVLVLVTLKNTVTSVDDVNYDQFDQFDDPSDKSTGMKCTGMNANARVSVCHGMLSIYFNFVYDIMPGKCVPRYLFFNIVCDVMPGKCECVMLSIFSIS